MNSYKTYLILLQIIYIYTHPIDVSLLQNRFSISSTEPKTIDIQLKIKVNDELNSSEAPSVIPYEMTIVLDRSGSMDGEKLEKSKESIKSIIKNLNANDKLNVIVYNQVAKILFEKGSIEQKEELIQMIDSISAYANTNLYNGLELAIKTTQNSNENYLNKRIFLFSDGLANQGVTDHDEILQLVKNSEIITNSYGVGNDYDGVLMPNIAKYGKGEFFFIDSPESIEQVIRITSRGFMNLYGTQAKLKIYCPPGISLLKIYGKNHDSEGFFIGDLRKNDTLNFFTTFESDPKYIVDNNLECFYTMSYKNLATQQEEIIKGSFLKAELTDNQTKIEEKNEEIDAIFEIQNSVEKQAEVQEFLEDDDVKGAIDFMDKELNNMEKFKNNIKDAQNKQIAETAIRRVKNVKERTESNPQDTKGNIYKTQSTISLSLYTSGSYEEL